MFGMKIIILYMNKQGIHSQTLSFKLWAKYYNIKKNKKKEFKKIFIL